MENYDTVTAALNALRSQGYTIDFNVAFNTLIQQEGKAKYNPSDFGIRKVFRFEGDTNPDDEAVVYGIESFDGEIKGVMVSAFGTYADAATNDIIMQLSMLTKE